MSVSNMNSATDKGRNMPYQLAVLQGLKQIKVNGDDAESLLSAILATLQSEKDWEAKLVVDDNGNGSTYLEVRTRDVDSGVWDAPVYYAPGSNVGIALGALVAPIIYINPNTLLAQILAELLAQGLTLDGIKTQTDLLTFVTGALNVVLPSGVQSSRYVLTVGITPVVVIAGSTEVSVMNTGIDNITVDTGMGPVVLKSGISLSWRAREGKTLGAYTFTGSSASSEYIYTAVI